MNMKTQNLTPVQSNDAVLQLELDMVEILQEQQGMPERDAYELARGLVEGMRKRYGGYRGFYIPAPSKAQRDAQICKDFNGRNVTEVCRKHGIKRTQVYEILKRGGRPIGQASAAAPRL